MLKKYFLHLEGMDLSGKTTTAELIAKNSGLNWKIYNNCLSERNLIQELTKKLAERNIYDDEIYGYLHFVALKADIKFFELRENIIQDSTILLRSLNYHKEAGNYELVKYFEELAKSHPRPNISIYLTASIEARRNRLNKRINEDSLKITRNDKLPMNNPEKFLKMEKSLMELSKKYFNSIVLDTSDMTEIQTSEFIINLLREGKFR